MISPSASRNSAYLDSYEASPYGSGAGAGYSSSKGAMLAKGARLNQGGGADDDRIGKSPYWSPEPPGIRGFSGAINRSGSSTTTQRTVRMGEAPKMPDLPTFKAPEINKRAIKADAQKLAAPGIRTLRETVQQAMGKNYENPNVRKMTLREALQGYGTGLEKVMSGANREARSNQMAEVDLQRQEAQMNFQAQQQAAMASYQNAWADYLKGSETVSETSSESGGAENTFKIGSRTYTRDPLSGRPVPVY